MSDNSACPAFLQFWFHVIYRKSAYKNGFHCYLCSLYDCARLLLAIFFKGLQIWKISYVNWLKFVCCLQLTRLTPDSSKSIKI